MLSFASFSKLKVNLRDAGGEGWIRTSVRLRGQIYSLLPLTTRPPLQAGQAAHMAMRVCAVNCSTGMACREAPETALRVAARFARALQTQHAPGMLLFGAGEGNRTLVVSLEGFCSTIELHPLVQAEAPNAIAGSAQSTAGSTANDPFSAPKACRPQGASLRG